MTRLLFAVLPAVVAAASPPPLAAAEPPPPPEHPFILWDRDDLAAVRERIETEPWAKAAWEAGPRDRGDEPLFDLLRYAAFDDAEAGDRQKKRLMRTVGSKRPRGGAQWVNVLRYDLLHDLLTDDERAAVQQFFRAYIDDAIFTNAVFDPAVFNTERNYQRYDAKWYTRTNWLPNIVWPRRVSANLMAAALGDRALIEKTWDHYGSWRWYFDAYLAGPGFYSEEFSKMGATPGAMLLYCRAVERLGMNGLGFGYTGRGGATMRGHLRSLIMLGYPRVTLHSGLPHYPMLTIGDLRGSGSSRQGKNLPTFAFQHSLVRGYLPDEQVGDPEEQGSSRGIQRWQAHGAWGGEVRENNPQWDGYSNFTPKMQLPLWFEFAHARWPDDGYGYFLAHTREPGQDRYAPSLYFGVQPIAPGDVPPPRAASWVDNDRGLAMLRADESRGYWEADAPAVGLRLAAPYAHGVNDAFTLAGFYAFNRPIYLNRQTRRGYASGYTRSVLSHAGVKVDDREPRTTRHVVTRHGWYPPAKFLAMRSDHVYPGIDYTRAFVLGDGWLLEVTRLVDASGDDHEFTWVVHALGQAEVSDRGSFREHEPDGPLADFGRVLSIGPTDKSAGAVVVQRPGLDDPAQALLPKAWYDRGVGVSVGVSADRPITFHVAPTPIEDPKNKPLKSDQAERHLREVGGTSLIATASGPSVMLHAFHLPFEGGEPPPVRVANHPTGDADVIAQCVVDPRDGRPDTWVLIDLREETERGEPAAVEVGEGAAFTFADHAVVAVSPGRVSAWGDVRRIAIESPGETVTFTHNGRTDRGEVADGRFVYESEHQ